MIKESRFFHQRLQQCQVSPVSKVGQRQQTFKRRADDLDITPILNSLLDVPNAGIIRALQVLNKLIEAMDILELVDLVQRYIRELGELEPILV